MLLLLQYTIIFASVLMLVALGGCFSEHSGVINLGLEGIMLIGALGGAITLNVLGAKAPAGVIVLAVTLVSILFGMLYSALLGVACINFKADQTLVGTAMNMLSVASATVIPAGPPGGAADGAGMGGICMAGIASLAAGHGTRRHIAVGRRRESGGNHHPCAQLRRGRAADTAGAGRG